jgi:ParB-like chromosome segregation protein Spo0J
MSGHLKLVRRPKSTAKAKAVTEIAISEIVIGKRHRKDMGDIAELASDIATIDMLEPIVVRPIDGGRYELAR